MELTDHEGCASVSLIEERQSAHVSVGDDEENEAPDVLWSTKPFDSATLSSTERQNEHRDVNLGIPVSVVAFKTWDIVYTNESASGEKRGQETGCFWSG